MAAQKLGNISEGNTIELLENGRRTEFYVVQHNYEPGLNGAGRTLLLRKYLLDGSTIWSSKGTNDYSRSTVDNRLNTEYKATLDESVVSAMGTTDFYHAPSWSSAGIASRLARAVFLLSAIEYGYTNELNLVVEGTPVPNAEIYQRGRRNGTAENHWTRTPSSSRFEARYIRHDADLRSQVVDDENYKYYIRPAFTLPASILIQDDGTVLQNTAPSTPSYISVPSSVKGGASLSVSWPASTDAENNLEGYTLERQVDGGAWAQVYKGTALSFRDTAQKSWKTVKYRVRAYDSISEYSGYRTSSTVSVKNSSAYTSVGGVIRNPETVVCAGGVVRNNVSCYVCVNGTIKQS